VRWRNPQVRPCCHHHARDGAWSGRAKPSLSSRRRLIPLALLGDCTKEPDEPVSWRPHSSHRMHSGIFWEADIRPAAPATTTPTRSDAEWALDYGGHANSIHCALGMVLSQYEGRVMAHQRHRVRLSGREPFLARSVAHGSIWMNQAWNSRALHDRITAISTAGA
jgi:hypothetical protein